MRHIAIVLLGTALVGCTGPTPGYCNSTEDCQSGQCCDPDRNQCQACLDSGIDADASIMDLRSDASQLKDIIGDLPVDQSVDVVTDVGPPKCNNGKLEGTEECDGSQFGGASCTKSGFDSGSLVCSKQCKVLYSGCFTKGYVKIPKGSNFMGSDSLVDVCISINEKRHMITLTKSYEVSATEVTQAQYFQVMSNNPSNVCTKSNCPVNVTNWHMAAHYCTELSKQMNLPVCYYCIGNKQQVICSQVSQYVGGSFYDCPGYRLPTEAEWEYAYRAGTTTPLYNGSLTNCLGPDTNADAIAWYNKNSNFGAHAVGGKKANAWGLYDMAGNVSEWCNDWFQADLGSSPVSDPWGPSTGQFRVMKGGNALHAAFQLRGANRWGILPSKVGDTSSEDYGFRCVRTLQ
jgi:formylglycine-generating enzyme required for sulfatase activity